MIADHAAAHMQIARDVLHIAGRAFVLDARHRNPEETAQHAEQQDVVHYVLIVHISVGGDGEECGGA
ncbi:hypothetical protein D3C85_1866520 [compost metagenome]